MHAVVESGGFQYKVTENQTICVPKVPAEIGQVLRLSNVLMVYDEKNVAVGTPYVEGAAVEGKVISHGKRPKIVVYKYKSKKNYRRKRGHRQHFTELLVTRIVRPGERPEGAEPEPEEVAQKSEVEPKAAAAGPRGEPQAETPRRRRRILRRRKVPKEE